MVSLHHMQALSFATEQPSKAVAFPTDFAQAWRMHMGGEHSVLWHSGGVLTLIYEGIINSHKFTTLSQCTRNKRMKTNVLFSLLLTPAAKACSMPALTKTRSGLILHWNSSAFCFCFSPFPSPNSHYICASLESASASWLAGLATERDYFVWRMLVFHHKNEWLFLSSKQKRIRSVYKTLSIQFLPGKLTLRNQTKQHFSSTIAPLSAGHIWKDAFFFCRLHKNLLYSCAVRDGPECSRAPDLVPKLNVVVWTPVSWWCWWRSWEGRGCSVLLVLLHRKPFPFSARPLAGLAALQKSSGLLCQIDW